MPTVETSIWLALRGRVESLALDPALAVAWPKEVYEPTGGPYIEVIHLPNTPRRLFLNGSEPHQRLGILQLTLIYPVSSKHDVVTDIEITGQIAEHFPAGLIVRRDGLAVTITQAPDIARGFQEDGYWRTPISIRWECFA